MFLNRCERDQGSDESGSALVVVIGVMAVGLILTTLAMNSVVHGFGFTTATRAGVQSQGGAEAGIAAARAGLYPDATSHLNNCATQPTSATYASTTTPGPIYAARVEQYDATGWHFGCPTATTTQVRVTSTGTAQAHGVAGQSAGDTSKVEAVLQWLVPGPVPSGVGMYLYKGATVEANSSLDLSESTSAGLMIKNGNFYCNKNNTVINGSILVNGSLAFDNKCSVNGSAWVSGSAALGSQGSIAHDLSAGSVSPNPPGSHVGGTYTQGGSMPTVPPWADLGYTPTDWRDSTGTPYEVKTLAGCALPNGNLGGTILGQPAIIDARSCVGGPTASNNTTVKLTSDVVIFAERFSWDAVNSLVFASSSSAVHRLWFITPDYTADHQPTCQTGAPLLQGNFTVKNGFAINSPIQAFLYTPCAFEGKNGFTWQGQLYTGTYSYVQNNPSFTFTPMGVAGVDLGTGLPTNPVDYPKPGAVVSIRDLSGP